MTALEAPVDPALVEQAAEAAYVAAMTMSENPLPYEPWDKLNEYWRRIYRVQVRAVIDLIGGAS